MEAQCYRAKTLVCTAIIASVLLLQENPGRAGQPDTMVRPETGDAQSPAPDNSIFDGTLVNMTWPEVQRAAEDHAIVLLPVAVIEQHGPHLCLGTDTYLAYRRTLALKQKLDSLGVRAVVAPPFYWGIMQLNESGAFPGSFTVSPGTMKALLGDIFSDLHRWGFRHVYCFNHHGDFLHRRTLNEAIAEAKAKLGISFYNDQEENDHGESPDIGRYVTGKMVQPDYHSGAFETSLMLGLYPALVKPKIALGLKPESTWQPLGYVGDPANYGKVNMLAMSREDVEHIAGRIAGWYKRNTEKAE